MNITLTLNESELQNLQALLDAGVRHMGLQAAMPAAIIGQKIAHAIEQAKNPPAPAIVKDAA